MKILLAILGAAGLAGAEVRVPLRSRVELFKSTSEWREIQTDQALDPQRTAIILCDMWDRHWCRGASERVNELVPKVNPVLEAARRRGILVIHAPSDTMDYYKDDPRRTAMAVIRRIAPPEPLGIWAPPLPVDDNYGGCDTGDSSFKAWTREHPGIRVEANDLISDKGDEVYSALKLRGIGTLLVAGVHTNMCILNRTFAIKQMTNWGVRCILIRDLTDSMYDPKDRPNVTHEQGTELVIQHIEKYWAPTMLSKDLIKALGN